MISISARRFLYSSFRLGNVWYMKLSALDSACSKQPTAAASKRAKHRKCASRYEQTYRPAIESSASRTGNLEREKYDPSLSSQIWNVNQKAAGGEGTAVRSSLAVND